VLFNRTGVTRNKSPMDHARRHAGMHARSDGEQQRKTWKRSEGREHVDGTDADKQGRRRHDEYDNMINMIL
jgi:hypothetical protein